MAQVNRQIPTIDLINYVIEHEVLKYIPEAVAKKYKLIPLFKVRESLTIAMADPSDVVAIDEAKAASGCDIQTVRAEENEILMVIDQNYNVSNSIDGIIQSLQSLKADFVHDQKIDSSRIQKIVEEPPVIKLVNLMVLQALKDGASDIHVEPEKDKVRVRLRIDGLLHPISSFPIEMLMPVVSRVKVMAQLNIAEMRQPQDGHFTMHLAEREVDIRVSTFPVAYGEKVEMRLFDRATAFLSLEKLGMSKELEKRFNELINKPYGIILVTGPTGSGKTSTLYASLAKMNAQEKNIVTLEDPREYLLEGVNQAEVNTSIGFTFAVGLRTILRQDPDVIMIGEVRDAETAQIAVRSALTGHLVFSTLHTNDAAGAVTRLKDMGIEPFLIASGIVGILAQRLVRKICVHCKEDFIPESSTCKILGITDASKAALKRGKGCLHCRYTGFKGRTGIYELLTVTDEVRSLITGNASLDQIKKAAQGAGMMTLREDGIKKVLQGVTTLEEVMRETTNE